MGNQKYIGIILFCLAVVALFVVAYLTVYPKFKAVEEIQGRLSSTQTILEEKRAQRDIIVKKIAKLKQSALTSQKKIYSPIENYGDDKNDTLFFTLYSDVMEMLHANSIKIKSIDYKYNPSDDIFTKQGGLYFVCDVNMDIVSNYVNLGKLIQDIYQYPYYIKINSVDVKPYPRDKKILLSKLSLRLYAHTDTESSITDDEEEDSENTIEGAEQPIPQE